MIALIMFLFLSGGAKKAKPAPTKPLLGPYTYPSEPETNYGVYCDQGGCVDTSQFKYWGNLPSSTDFPLEVVATDGSKMVKLSDSEYSHLQDLRKAVADEEKRLAVKYGAKPSCWDTIPKNSDTYCYDGYGPDHFEYHGQFLLIEKGKP